MRSLHALLWSILMLACGAACAAADVGVATLVDTGTRVLRGATWYKVVPGTRLEEGDIVEIPERAQLQIELAAGTAVNTVGPGSLHVVRASAREAPVTLALQRAWVKAAAKPPGVRLHTPALDVASADGVIVMHADPPPEVFVESGAARVIEIAPNGSDATAHDAKSGEHWSKSQAGPYVALARPPKAFVDAMPRPYLDALPSLAARFKTKPALALDHEITYAEAEPWLSGRERAAFEKRFASRLRDPVFRKAVEPSVARYPSWDRMLHPEKYKPKPASPPVTDAPK